MHRVKIKSNYTKSHQLSKEVQINSAKLQNGVNAHSLTGIDRVIETGSKMNTYQPPNVVNFGR